MSRLKSEYLRYGFSGVDAGGKTVTIGGVAITRAEMFSYLSSIIKKKEILTKKIPVRLDTCKIERESG